MTRVRGAAAVLVAGVVAGLLASCGSGGNATATSSAPPTPSASSTGSQASADPSSHASGSVPRPSHVVIVVEENHSTGNVIGNAAAPYINSLASQNAFFTDSAAVAHPSEPNYAALFSGSTQGLTDDSCPHTYVAGNLGAQLAAAGQTFAGYSESLPSVGFLGCTAGDYARKHAPWTNFPSVPASANLPFTAFPTDYSTLPTVSIVVPNLANDMHNGSVHTGDTWLRDNLDAYAQWATTHNSLLIVTWDEDDDHSGNKIPTIFAGAHVKPGRYSEHIDHYRVLRTIEAAYGLEPLGHAAETQPITDVWS
ncbi:alkaline phosphatase family protein [Sinomonas sp. JGH33]|uniref:Alkaline phosphatase family protein n=1 Tax=Sinomonas terricola TaxID=3110330 RepID=A0ABU5TAE7_9MICC|nr:alkaline phosphatase family protein [Sinomonas sp. JGH33]MEA5456676.1 alkaline phosphatase family protein [Sinomonas sp. JGH33]